MDKRRGRVKWGVNGTRSVTSTAYWRKPLKWEREAKAAGVRRRVFCVSLGDVFEDREELKLWRERLFDLIDETPNLDWLLLTKRPENIRKMWPLPTWTEQYPGCIPKGTDQSTIVTFRKNVWLGTSISDQATADKAIPALLRCRDLSPVLFLSAEPLLGPIDLFRWTRPLTQDSCLNCGWDGIHEPMTQEQYAAVKHTEHGNALCPECGATADVCAYDDCLIDWVIVGGESGPAARPCDARWIIDIADQCADADVPCFVKQLGANAWLDSIAFDAADPGARLKLTDKKGGDPAEWPEDLRVREFPTTANQQ